MGRDGPFRTVVALLLAAWMPFCCCTLRLFLDARSTCCPRERPAAPTCHEGPAACHASSDDEPTPCPGHNDEGRCACGKDALATIGAERVGAHFPAPALTCVLPRWSPPWAPDGRAPAADRAGFASRIPATSLLRLHCALII